MRKNFVGLLAILMLSGLALHAQSLAPRSTELTEWQFAKQKPTMWTRVTLPHSCNAVDGRSAKYYRGKSYYRRVLNLTEAQCAQPLFLHFQQAGQAAVVEVNGQQVFSHGGGYTPFVVPLNGQVHAGENVLLVQCDNHLDVQLAPVSSDFNKNNGLYAPVHLLEMNEVYAAPQVYGSYRLHVMPQKVSAQKARLKVQTCLVNSSNRPQSLKVAFTLSDAQGKAALQKQETVKLPAGDTLFFERLYTVKSPHLWKGLEDPYLYTASLVVNNAQGQVLENLQTRTGFRFYGVDKEGGFTLNGKPYPLRGVCMHQDLEGKATAVTEADLDRDFEIVKELGCNFMRLAHYPHVDYTFSKCDELGIVVQTEIPWVNVCGVKAEDRYFNNLQQQLEEMIANLYNHPSIVFWGLFNELAGWGNNDQFQGRLDENRVVTEETRLYRRAKELDPQRLVGPTDCTSYRSKGYEGLAGDFFSENQYFGWYHSEVAGFKAELERINQRMGVTNVSEYGCGINPFCHSLDPLHTTERGTGGRRHDEEYGNYLHEGTYAQMMQMPFLTFTSLWILFDFAVADRLEGYMDTSDGETFTETDFRKYTNDKGLVSRDRQVKKDVFYLYKALWNKNEETVYITSRRFTQRPSGEPLILKVYSNARKLTLYQNGMAVQTLEASNHSTGVVWTFEPLKFKSASDTFKVISDTGTSDQVTFSAK